MFLIYVGSGVREGCAIVVVLVVFIHVIRIYRTKQPQKGLLILVKYSGKLKIMRNN